MEWAKTIPRYCPFKPSDPEDRSSRLFPQSFTFSHTTSQKEQVQTGKELPMLGAAWYHEAYIQSVLGSDTQKCIV